MTEATDSRIAQRRRAALLEAVADYGAKRAELIRSAADVFREKGDQVAQPSQQGD